MAALNFLALGGMGAVTQNMYLYQYEEEILVVDCGIGFPGQRMPGVDILIPDISYLEKLLAQGKRIAGMILTHGHDDHIAALPYLLPHLPAFPIYGSPLTIGFAQQRVAETKLEPDFRVVKPGTRFSVGAHFQAQAVRVTHSVPDTMHYALTTPVGLFYHGSDFRLDPSPIDGLTSDREQMAMLGQAGVRCLLIDCLRVENPTPAQSESTIGPELEHLMVSARGKFIVTLMSSHIHRIQQVVDAAEKLGRRLVFIGRSVEQNVRIASELGLLHLNPRLVVEKRDAEQLPDRQACLIVAGSQGQEGSSLIRAISGEHPVLQIKPSDTVVFSADAIPGNELSYFGAIDELASNGVEVLYPDINPNLHHSGHASAPEQRELLTLLRPQLVMPIGGANRHRYKFIDFVAAPSGYAREQVLLPRSGEVLVFTDAGVSVGEVVPLNPPVVDGLGIGDVGPAVLSDRLSLGQAGIVVVVIPKRGGQLRLDEIKVVSRGFVFMQQAEEVVEFIIESTREIVRSLKRAPEREVKKAIERRLGRKLYKVIQREPLIVPLILELA